MIILARDANATRVHDKQKYSVAVDSLLPPRSRLLRAIHGDFQPIPSEKYNADDREECETLIAALGAGSAAVLKTLDAESLDKVVSNIAAKQEGEEKIVEVTGIPEIALTVARVAGARLSVPVVDQITSAASLIMGMSLAELEAATKTEAIRAIMDAYPMTGDIQDPVEEEELEDIRKTMAKLCLGPAGLQELMGISQTPNGWPNRENREKAALASAWESTMDAAFQAVADETAVRKEQTRNTTREETVRWEVAVMRAAKMFARWTRLSIETVYGPSRQGMETVDLNPNLFPKEIRSAIEEITFENKDNAERNRRGTLKGKTGLTLQKQEALPAIIGDGMRKYMRNIIDRAAKAIAEPDSPDKARVAEVMDHDSSTVNPKEVARKLIAADIGDTAKRIITVIEAEALFEGAKGAFFRVPQGYFGLPCGPDTEKEEMTSTLDAVFNWDAHRRRACGLGTVNPALRFHQSEVGAEERTEEFKQKKVDDTIRWTKAKRLSMRKAGQAVESGNLSVTDIADMVGKLTPIARTESGHMLGKMSNADLMLARDMLKEELASRGERSAGKRPAEGAEVSISRSAKKHKGDILGSDSKY